MFVFLNVSEVKLRIVYELLYKSNLFIFSLCDLCYYNLHYAVMYMWITNVGLILC